MTRYFVQVKWTRWCAVHQCEALQYAHALAHVIRTTWAAPGHDGVRVLSEYALRKEGSIEAVREAEEDLAHGTRCLEDRVYRIATSLVRKALPQVEAARDARAEAEVVYREAIQRAYEVGYTLAEVGSAADLSVERVRQIVHENPTSRVIQSSS